MTGARYGRWRRASQAAFALLFVALPFLGSAAVSGTAIALRIGAVDLLEPASALSAWLAAGAIGAASVLATLPLLALTAAAGSVYCGWICPFGLLSEGLDRLRGRRPWRGEPWVRARAPRLAALAILLLLSALAAAPLAGWLAPPRVLTALPLEARVLRAAPLVTLALLAGLVALDLLLPRRLLCRALCPVGGVAALVRARAWRPRFDAERCRCPAAPACLAVCAWGLDPRRMKGIDGCTSCLACVDRCPSGALTIRSARG